MDPVGSCLPLHWPILGPSVLPRRWNPRALPLLSFLVCEGSPRLLAAFFRQYVQEVVGASIQTVVPSEWVMEFAGIRRSWRKASLAWVDFARGCVAEMSGFFPVVVRYRSNSSACADKLHWAQSGLALVLVPLELSLFGSDSLWVRHRPVVALGELVQ